MDYNKAIRTPHELSINYQPGQLIVTKEMLGKLQLIGQVNSEFIATFLIHGVDRYLILLDQHAVDERIRLEHLRREFKNECQPFQRDKLQFPLEMTIYMPEENVKQLLLCLDNVQGDLLSSGIVCSFTSFTNNIQVTVTEAPLLLLRKILKRDSYNNYLVPIKEVVTKIVLNEAKINGKQSGRTTLFSHVLATEACARAIKFGHSLDKETMGNLLLALNQCHLPFQCAHGRPTLQVIRYESLRTVRHVKKLSI